MHHVLENLTSDAFALKYSFISNPIAVYRALQRSVDVENVRLALRSGEITEEILGAFCASVLAELQPGKRLPQELALAAIAVVLETRATSFAEEYVLDLARLDLAEFPTAIRVARQAYREQKGLPANKTKEFTLGDEELGLSQGEWCPAPHPREVAVGQSEQYFELEMP